MFLSHLILREILNIQGPSIFINMTGIYRRIHCLNCGHIWFKYQLSFLTYLVSPFKMYEELLETCFYSHSMVLRKVWYFVIKHPQCPCTPLCSLLSSHSFIISSKSHWLSTICQTLQRLKDADGSFL